MLREVEVVWLDTAAKLPSVDDAHTIFGTAEWLRAWEAASVEHVLERRYLCAVEGARTLFVLPLYLITYSPFWSGYGLDAGLGPVWDGPVVFAPSLYSFYCPVHTKLLTTVRFAPFIEEAVAQADRWEATAFVLTNLTPQTFALLRPLRAPLAAIRLDATFVLLLPNTMSGYLSNLQRDERTDLRRRWRRATERGVSYVELEDEAMRSRLPAFVDLANESAVKHHIPPLYDLTTLNSLSYVQDARLALAVRDEEVLGGFMTFTSTSSDTLYVWSGGIRYTAQREFSPYVFLLYEVVRSAIERGYRRLEFGRGNYDFKRRHGFVAVELWSLVYPCQRGNSDALGQRLTRMHRRLSAFMGLGT